MKLIGIIQYSKALILDFYLNSQSYNFSHIFHFFVCLIKDSLNSSIYFKKYIIIIQLLFNFEKFMDLSQIYNKILSQLCLKKKITRSQ